MKVLFYTTQLGRSYVQGTERYVTGLAGELRIRGHEVLHLAGDPLRLDKPRRPGTCVDGEQALHAMPSKGWMTIVGLSGRRMRRWLKQVNPDIVHVNNAAHVGIGLLDACRALGIPYLVTVHDFWWICPKGTLMRPDGEICDGTPGWGVCTRCLAADHQRKGVRRLSRLPLLGASLAAMLFGARGILRGMPAMDLARWTRRRSILLDALNRAAFVIFPSKATSDVFGNQLETDRWCVIPNGLDRNWFHDRRRPLERVLPPDRLVIGYAGALSPHKAPHLLLQALRYKRWFNTLTILVGPASDGAYLEKVRREATGLNVRIRDRLGAEQMSAFYRSLDVLAVTSVWPENYPYVVLEAQAAGIPVVGPRIGGITDQIGNERMLFEPGSREGLAEALDYVRQHPDGARPWRVTSVEEMADELYILYERALSGRP